MLNIELKKPLLCKNYFFLGEDHQYINQKNRRNYIHAHYLIISDNQVKQYNNYIGHLDMHKLWPALI